MSRIYNKSTINLVKAVRNSNVMDRIRAGVPVRDIEAELRVNKMNIYAIFHKFKNEGERIVDYKPHVCSKPTTQRTNSGPHKVTLELVDRLRNGESTIALAVEYGISRQRVRRIWAKYKTPDDSIRDYRRRNDTQEFIDNVSDVIRKGMSAERTAQLVGRSSSWVRDFKKKYCADVPHAQRGNTEWYADTEFLEFKEQIENGTMSKAEAQRKIGCNYITAHRRFKRLGINRIK